MPVSAYDFLFVAFSYLLVISTPAVLIVYLVRIESSKKNLIQITLAIVSYPLYFFSWHYFGRALDAYFDLRILGLFVSFFMLTILLALLLILFKRTWITRQDGGDSVT